MACRSRQPVAGAGGNESLLADVFWNRVGEDRGGFRLAGRMAVASRAARLAGYRVYPHRLGCKGHAEADCHQCNLPTVIEDHARAPAERPGESPPGSWTALSSPSGRHSGPGPGHFWSAGRENRRGIGKALPARWTVERDQWAELPAGS